MNIIVKRILFVEIVMIILLVIMIGILALLTPEFTFDEMVEAFIGIELIVHLCFIAAFSIVWVGQKWEIF